MAEHEVVEKLHARLRVAGEPCYQVPVQQVWAGEGRVQLPSLLPWTLGVDSPTPSPVLTDSSLCQDWGVSCGELGSLNQCIERRWMTHTRSQDREEKYVPLLEA